MGLCRGKARSCSGLGKMLTTEEEERGGQAGNLSCPSSLYALVPPAAAIIASAQAVTDEE